MIKKLKIRVLNLLLRNLFNAVTINDIIVVNKGRVIVAGKELTKAQILALKSDAKLLERCELYKLIKKNLRHEAHNRLYNNSVTTDDMIFGKAMLHNLSLMNNFIKKFK